MDVEVERYAIIDDETRYKNDDRIVYDTGEEIIETSDRLVVPEGEDEEYYTVEIGFEGRLDLISYKFYDTAEYWWAIAAANEIYNPFEIKVGDVLRIPSFDIISSL